MNKSQRHPLCRFSSLLILSASITWLVPIAHAQNLYVANFGTGTISEYASDGSLVNAQYASGLNNPSGFAFDSAGRLYAANHNGGLRQAVSLFDAAGDLLNATFIPDQNVPEGVAFDAAGHIFVSNSGGNFVQEYDATGQTLIRTLSNPNFDSPIGLAFDRHGNLYVPNRGNGKVLKFDANGDPVGDGIFISGLDHPEGVALDSLGRIYVASFTSGVVYQFAADGTLLNPAFASGLQSPIGVAFDTNGDLYVGNFTGNAVSKFGPDGTLIDASYISGVNMPSYVTVRGVTLPISVPTPSLTMTTSGSNVTISWPLTADYILEQTPDLTAATWDAASYPITTNGVTESISFAPTPGAGSQFFRLKNSDK